MTIPSSPVRKNDRSARMASAVILALSVVLGVNFAVLEFHRFRAEAAKRAQRAAMASINDVLLVRDDPAMVVSLLKRIPAEEAKRRPLLERAAFNGRIETVRVLLEQGFPADGRNGTGNPLRMAAAYGNTPMVTLLLKHGAKGSLLNLDGRNALHLAAAAGRTEAVHVLLNAGVPVDAPTGPPPSLGEDAGPFMNSISALPQPVAPGEMPSGTLTLDNEYRERGVTPLMFAAGGGHADTVGVLLARGANVGQRSSRGRTAHFFAARFNHPEVVQQLQRAAIAAARPGGR